MSETSVSNVSFKRPVVAGADNKNSGVRVNVPAKSAADSVELSTKGKSDEKKKPDYVKIGLSVLGAAACIYGGVKLFKYFKGKPGGGGSSGGGGGAAGKVEPKKPKVDISKSETGSKGNADGVSDGAKSASAPKTGVAEESPKILKADNAGGASENAAEKTSGLGENGAGNADALKTGNGNAVADSAGGSAELKAPSENISSAAPKTDAAGEPLKTVKSDNAGGASESAAENSSKTGSGLKTDAAENTSKTLGTGEVPKTDNAVEPQQKKIVSVSEKQKLPELETGTFKPDKPLDYAEFLKTASADKKLLLDKTASGLNKKYNIVDEKSIEDIKPAALASLAMTAFLLQSGFLSDDKDIKLLSDAEFLDNCGAELTDGKRENLNKPVTELLNGISNETIDNCQNLPVEAKSYLKERFDVLKENFAYIDFDSWVDGAGEENSEVSELQKPAEAQGENTVSVEQTPNVEQLAPVEQLTPVEQLAPVEQAVSVEQPVAVEKIDPKTVIFVPNAPDDYDYKESSADVQPEKIYDYNPKTGSVSEKPVPTQRDAESFVRKGFDILTESVQNVQRAHKSDAEKTKTSSLNPGQLYPGAIIAGQTSKATDRQNSVNTVDFGSTQSPAYTVAFNNNIPENYGYEDLDESFRRNQEQSDEAAKKQRERDEEFWNNMNAAATGAYAVDNLTGQSINSGVDNIYSDNSIITGYNSSPEPQPFDYNPNDSMFGTSTGSDYEYPDPLNNSDTDYTATDLLGGGDYLSGNVGDYGSDF